MESKNENAIMGLVPRAVALAISLVITLSVTAAFAGATDHVRAEFRQASLSNAVYASVLQAH